MGYEVSLHYTGSVIEVVVRVVSQSAVLAAKEARYISSGWTLREPVAVVAVQL